MCSERVTCHRVSICVNEYVCAYFRISVLHNNLRAHTHMHAYTDILGLDPMPDPGADFVGSALLKPCFSPFDPGICAIATEEHPLQSGTPYLIIALIHRNPRAALRKIAYMVLDTHPSALQWYTFDFLFPPVCTQLVFVM